MAGRVEGKMALVTGAGSGLGAAIAAMLAREGAKVALTDVNAEAVKAVAAEIEASAPGRVFAYAHDVTSEEQWIDVLNRATGDMGGLNVLVHNAGIGSKGNIEEETLESWRKTHAVDTDSIFLGTKHALNHMRPHAPGSIVIISSIAGLVADGNMAAYNSAKAAAWLLSKSIALYCAKKAPGIRCNSVHPAFVKTKILDPFVAMAGGDEALAHQKLARNIPLGHIGEPDDVAYGVLYLASDESKFVTGAELKIDGGLSAN